MVSQVLIRLPKTAVGFDLLLLELFLDPITQGFHHRTALGLMIFESRALTHSHCPRVVFIDFPDRFQNSQAFQRKVLLDLLELPSTVRQTIEIYGRDLLLSVDGRRVRHFHRRPQSRVSLLQQIVQVLARMLATTLVERNPATFLIPDHYPARVRTLTFAFFPILVLLKTRKNLHSRIIDLKQLPIRRQFPQMAID